MRPMSPRWSISPPPASISATAPRAPIQPASPRTRSGTILMVAKGRILVVEDDKALVELLVYHFEREDFEVEHTPDGEEALIMARESPPDLVILDWMLESLSG